MEGLLALLFAALLGTTLMHGRTQPVDCRSCHAPNGAPGVRDFSHIYSQPAAHHPVGIPYPSATHADFHAPDGHASGAAFFDRNGNGKPDANEIRMYGSRKAARVECSSCHQEHGGASAPAAVAGRHHLRLDNAGSALCSTCHNK